MKKLAVTLAAAALFAVAQAQAAVITLNIPLTGAEEVPGPGDPDGSGLAVLKIDDTALTIDWEFTVSDIDLPLTGAHIHKAPRGVAGGVVVNFSAQLSGSGLFDADLAAVLADPSGYYVNLHTVPHPAGAIRGQLPDVTGLGCAALALGGILAFARRSRNAR